MSLKVSVVVPTRRRPELLKRCLRALADQTLDPCNYEIIVVDDGPDEQTRKLVDEGWTALDLSKDRCAQRELKFPDLCYLRSGRDGSSYGPAAARNRGWESARGEIIAFTDDDCIPTRAWLASGLHHFVDGVAGVSGRVEVPLPEHPTDYELNAAGLEASRFVTASCFYRRSALEALGGFDERFKTAWREDSDLYFRARKQGLRLEESPEAVVVHPVRPASWGVSLEQQRKSMYNALLYKKHPDLFRTLQPSPPWLYYSIFGSLVGAAVSFLAGRRLLSMIFSASWALGSLLFFVLRLRKTSRHPEHVVEMLITSILIPPLSIYWRLRGALKYRVFFL